jgi:hypothetical protein
LRIRLRHDAQQPQLGLELGDLADELCGDVGLVAPGAEHLLSEVLEPLDVVALCDGAGLLLDLPFLLQREAEVQPGHGEQAGSVLG